jgi:bis(5'-nucleosidyl)-tetraphosphatase
MEHKPAHSYGIIPLYKDYDGYKVLIVQNGKGGHWGFPKGTPEGDETPMQTAVRELYEETGIQEKDIRIQNDPVFIEQYSFEKDGIIYDKTNTYHVGYVDEMTIGKDLDEITAAQWLLIEETKKIFKYPAVIEIANQLEEHSDLLQDYNW